MNWQEFVYMGGYAAYVWSSFGLAAVLLAFNLVMPFLQHRTRLRKLQRQQARQGNQA